MSRRASPPRGRRSRSGHATTRPGSCNCDRGPSGRAGLGRTGRTCRSTVGSTPSLAIIAWTCALSPERSCTSLARYRTSSRSSRSAGGAIHASGRRPRRNMSARSVASTMSFFTRRSPQFNVRVGQMHGRRRAAAAHPPPNTSHTSPRSPPPAASPAGLIRTTTDRRRWKSIPTYSRSIGASSSSRGCCGRPESSLDSDSRGAEAPLLHRISSGVVATGPRCTRPSGW